MIESKKITLISILLLFAAVVFSMVIWRFSSGYESDYKVYDDTKIVFTNDDDYDAGNTKSAVKVIGKKNSISSESKNVYDGGDGIYITAGGMYSFEGDFKNIIIASRDERPVIIELNNANIVSSKEVPIYAYKLSKLILSSREGTQNTIMDKRKKYSEQSISSVVYSDTDITLNGAGNVNIETTFKDAVKSEKKIKIMSGNWNITADDDGISADVIYMGGGKVIANTVGDSIRCDVKDKKGLIALENGEIIVNSKGDGIYSSGNIYMNEISVNIKTGNGAENSLKNSSDEDLPSMKGIKSDKGIYVRNGKYKLDTDDDAFHAAEIIKVSNTEEMNIASGDDAMHSDKDLFITKGKINITKCYEGIEGAYIEINGGDINIIADDDGINAADGSSPAIPMDAMPDGQGGTPPDKPNDNGAAPNGQGGTPPDKPKPELNEEAERIMFKMTGGKIYIEAGGDGVDINGSCEMTGGRIAALVTKDGPENSFDYDGILKMNGGSFFGIGNPNMLQQPSDDSKECNIIAYPSNAGRENVKIALRDSKGKIIEEIESKGVNGAVSAYGERIEKGETYTLLVNGKEDGSVTVDKINNIIKSSNADDEHIPPMDANGKPIGTPQGNDSNSSGGSNNSNGNVPPMDANGKPIGTPPGEIGQEQSSGKGNDESHVPPMGEDGRPLEPPPSGNTSGSRKTKEEKLAAKAEKEQKLKEEAEENQKKNLIIIGLGTILIFMVMLILKIFKRKF